MRVREREREREYGRVSCYTNGPYYVTAIQSQEMQFYGTAEKTFFGSPELSVKQAFNSVKSGDNFSATL